MITVNVHIRESIAMTMRRVAEWIYPASFSEINYCCCGECPTDQTDSNPWRGKRE